MGPFVLAACRLRPVILDAVLRVPARNIAVATDEHAPAAWVFTFISGNIIFRK